jgi:hypothetical protein
MRPGVSLPSRAVPVLTPDRLKDTSGFALAMAIFALVILAAVVAGGYYSASQEFQIGRGMKSMTVSFYAAEAGIREVTVDWDPSIYNALAAGDSMMIGPVMMEGGASYTATVWRVGVDTDSTKRYFYIESTGRPGGPRAGERRQGAIARVRLRDMCCDAAVKVYSQIHLGLGNLPQVSAFNIDPPGAWPPSACADYPPDSIPGAVVRASTLIDDPDRIEGWPVAVLEDPSMTQAGMLTFDDITYADLVAMADHTFTGDHNFFFGTDPTLTPEGKCDTSNPQNFGAPEDPSHPCFNYFPIIHVTGSLHLLGNKAAQGIFLIGDDPDDDLTITGPFDFYGIAIVKDDLFMLGPVRMFGGAIVGDDVHMELLKPTITYSTCAVDRAVRLSNLAKPNLLPSRAFVELF